MGYQCNRHTRYQIEIGEISNRNIVKETTKKLVSKEHINLVMRESSQWLVKYTVWSTGKRTYRKACIDVLAAVI